MREKHGVRLPVTHALLALLRMASKGYAVLLRFHPLVVGVSHKRLGDRSNLRVSLLSAGGSRFLVGPSRFGYWRRYEKFNSHEEHFRVVGDFGSRGLRWGRRHRRKPAATKRTSGGSRAPLHLSDAPSIRFRRFEYALFDMRHESGKDHKRNVVTGLPQNWLRKHDSNVSWSAPGMVDTAGPQNEASSKTSGLTPPRWLCRHFRL